MHRTLAPERLAALVGPIDRDPAYRGLCQALQALIGDGRIPIGTRLPSERAVSQALGVSRNTVTRAYADLAGSGFASARQGSGTYAAAPPEHRRAHDRALRSLDPLHAQRGDIDLACAAGSAAHGIAAAYARALEELPAYLCSDGYLPSGLPALQARIAGDYTRRGLPTDAAQIVVTSGALSAIGIVARALSRPGQRITVESPGYPNAIEALRLGGAQLVSSPMADPLGEDGWDMAGIEATLGQTAPRFAYLIADFQNPTGFLMDDALRERYAAALRAAGTVAIVDETLQATRLSTAPMPLPFARHAADAITVGSASKLGWGGLRVGWIRAPRDQVERIVATRAQMDLGSSLFDQLVACELLGADDPWAARRARSRNQRDALAGALREHLPDWRFRLPDGGLSLWVQLPHGSATRLAAEVERSGLRITPGPVFGVDGGLDQWLRLPYARPEEQLVEAVKRMATAWETMPSLTATRRGRTRLLIA
ncbi:MAG: PLP-dependent aminotransferase family protein [Pseudoxanthomonas sp.]|nr:PLP-dependent aminotransferase family protein [Pseudoxanthomonas sp.]